MTEVISKVGCGHSSLWVPGKFWNVAPDKLFPLKLVISNNKTFVKGDYNNSQEIPVGSEIVSINNQSIPYLKELTISDNWEIGLYAKEAINMIEKNE
jgi:hypothetical protein